VPAREVPRSGHSAVGGGSFAGRCAGAPIRIAARGAVPKNVTRATLCVTFRTRPGSARRGGRDAPARANFGGP